ncbi:Muramoyltetrapeptide carboxypeptidase [hydrothermal vent metagenome]|uniref:Muramoyltetrapeptide carboxypeptidase n=1 Tax=hydrothermal vent metagenome TaxID=652676 RepID=A0A3B0SI44_9ZZZZ
MVKRKRIGICAPSTPFSRDDADRVIALAMKTHPEAELFFADQCFSNSGHFAGDDDLRCNSMVEMANDPKLDAIWFARGGYGAARITQQIVPQLGEAAHEKLYMGYSDAGNLLGALYRAGIGQQAHGPMPVDIRRPGGEEAIKRALDWLVDGAPSSLEATVKADQKYAAFNLTTMAMMVGTPLLPDLKDHVLMVEEISEYLYAFDRAMFNVTTHLTDMGLTGLRLGRLNAVPENERPFGENEVDIAKRWCDQAGIPYLGRADIGHDAGNKVVPFGMIPD